MKTWIERIIIKNRAPFEDIDITFNENEVAVLTAINGSGKTTLLSYIVDAWHEIVRPHFSNEFSGKENKFYRFSSAIFSIRQTEPSFVYIRFRNTENYIDFVDIRGKCDQLQYDNRIQLVDKIPFSNIQSSLDERGFVKQVSSQLSKKLAHLIFNNNVITYFPAYRHELPGYLNDPYKIDLNYASKSLFEGSLTNPIEVVAGLPQLANWIMDVVLDMDLYKQVQKIDGVIYDLTPERTILWSSLNSIISQTLISKKHNGRLRFGIGKRNSGGTRISIMCDNDPLEVSPSKLIYPSIFNLSSGESSMLCLFGEILRQADKIKNNTSLEQITGIVLIDEVDKHLHIRLQKEVLPALFKLFPKVQFILSSHSPFLNMGLAELIQDRTRIINLDNFGISTDPTTNDLYSEVYNMMICENDRFKNEFELLKEEINRNSKPLIITEGITDAIHIKKAKVKLGIDDLDVDFHQISEDWGDSKLRSLLDHLGKVKQNRKIIGVFDRDVESIIKDIEYEGRSYKNYGNNVYAFCIPVPNGRETYKNISIEFYYTDKEIKKEKDGRGLYFDNEVENLYNKTTNKPEYRKSVMIDSSKEKVKKIFDENKMCEVSKWIHSKTNFANLIESDEDFISDFDFTNFRLIFNRIKDIVSLPESVN